MTPDPERERGLRGLEERLGHRFADPALLDRALTHTSHAHQETGGQALHNEPLEFLGDSVLGFVVADLLHRRDPEGPEGSKSKARAHLVAAPSLARRAAELGLPALLRLGRGEEKTGGRKKASLWADAYEAVIAALYLDGGLEAAYRFVEGQFAADLRGARALSEADYKSALQELLQARGEPVPEYAVLAEEGPSHRRSFRVECRINGRPVSQGAGASKKTAQQEAARLALQALADGSAGQ
ncbi:MAG TPA: ribonuclease III [Vicinamibacteria bacterium]|nr:ribonuclease III [Vicinamibacteria bacterium]